jgi:hypothetical protein
LKPEDIIIRDPLIGSKCWLLHAKGIFILERGPGALRSICCTHAGAGGIKIYDGIPDENGFFPDEAMQPDDPNYHNRNGRLIYQANPSVMGAWMLDAGVQYGITIEAAGDQPSSNTFATITWLKHKIRQAPSPQ